MKNTVSRWRREDNHEYRIRVKHAYPDSMGGTLDDIAKIFTETGNEGCIFFLLCTAKSVPYRLRQRVFL